jgi:hypothetical protein
MAILNEQFRRMQKLAGIITEDQIGSDYSIELLVPKVYFNVETGELSGNKYEWYTEDELRAGADQTSYTDPKELDTVVFSNDYNTAMDFASEYPELLKVVMDKVNEDMEEPSLDDVLSKEDLMNKLNSMFDNEDMSNLSFFQKIIITAVKKQIISKIKKGEIQTRAGLKAALEKGSV